MELSVRSRPRGAVVLTFEMLQSACGSSFGRPFGLLIKKAEFEEVFEATGAGRMRRCQALGALYLIAKRAARRAGTYKEFHAKLPSSFTCEDPGFYVAAPLPTELIHTIMQFADGRTLAGFSICAPHLRVRADKIASEGLARITTLRLGQPAVASWKTELRLFAVLTNPPNLWSLLTVGLGTAWAPIRIRVQEQFTSNRFLIYKEPTTDYNLEDHRAAMVKWALRLGDAAVIEGIMRTTDPEERYHHTRNFYKYLYTRKRYLKKYLDFPTTEPEGYNAISNHFLHVERVQAAAAAGKSIAEYSPLLQSAAKHDRYFPGLDG